MQDKIIETNPIVASEFMDDNREKLMRIMNTNLEHLTRLPSMYITGEAAEAAYAATLMANTTHDDRLAPYACI